MATWKDGAAYAPLERPDGFATPVAEPLPAAEPYRAETPGPMQHPGGFDAAPQRQLSELGTTEQRGRDPRDSFKVASLALTAAPGHVTGRDPREPFANSYTPVVSPGPPPPTGPPLPPPPEALPPPGALPPPPGAPLGQSGAQFSPPAGPWAPPVPGAMLPAADRPVATPQPDILGWISAAVAFAGLVFSGGAAILLMLAGLIAWQGNQRYRWLARTSFFTGASLTVVQFILGEFGETGLAPGLLSLVICISFVVTLLRGRPTA